MNADPKSPTSGKPRRTQAERSQETRNKVCEATLKALVEVGYEQISTTLIAQKANVSRGALTHQFPTRNDMLVAAFERLVEGWRDGYPFSLDPDKTQLKVDELIDALWQNIFADGRYIAAMELMLAARQDNDLGHALRDILVSWIRKRDRITVRLVGGNVDDAEAELRVQLHLSVLRGIAMHQSFDSDPETANKLIDLWKRIAQKA
ncbi:TetR/AcrR family transcriptional regulator [Celeribacter litoreus]|uniref:TetR/AcrR family transcriptional regulator n=1 Tax=Celeribacter litoreus TaxID=2876714 RepID=UPI001CCFAA3F|nr:TetR/AcrR family transcriptional regulator [Celeribacter litoreus]MCA0042203.1 TetR/AcrR family transcriptional regulator [Celeribacter litoreus]